MLARERSQFSIVLFSFFILKYNGFSLKLRGKITHVDQRPGQRLKEIYMTDKGRTVLINRTV